MSLGKVRISTGVTVVLLAMSWIAHATCSPALSSCDLMLFIGKACLFAVPIVWVAAWVMPRLNRFL